MCWGRSLIIKDKNVHRFTVRGGKNREGEREKKRKRPKESVCQRER